MSIFNKIKKYLLILSIFFSGIIISHLLYIYLYEDSNKIPEIGGTISVGFIGDAPSINPLEFSQNTENDYILKFLYRSLLKYDIKTKRMEGDLANCDLGKDFSKIKCYIKSDSLWNDGTHITKEDVLETYKKLKKTDINKPLKQILSSIDIIDKGDYIEFSSKNADVLLLDSFAIPIIKKDEIDTIIEGKITSDTLTTSGPYNFLQKELDTQYNIKKISIIRKDSNSSDIYILKYVFKFFPDSNSLSKNEDSLNIIFEDSNTKKILVSPRFEQYKYILPQYIGLFLNSEKIVNTDLRKFLIFQLENANYDSIYSNNTGKKINNPYFSEQKIIPELTNKNIVSILNSLGFYKKEVLIANIEKKYNEDIKKQNTSTGITSSVYFTTPTNKKISFVNNIDEILISGNIPTGIESVYINDYKLSSFVSGNTKFYFRAKKEFNTLKSGINYYTLSFEKSGKKTKRETITIYAYEKSEDLEAKKQEVLVNISKSKELSIEEKNKRNEEKKSELLKIENLDPIFYYDNNYKKFTLNLEYSSNGQNFLALAEKIKNEFKLIGIDINLVSDDQKKLEEIISKGDKTYDLLLTGVSNGLFYYNISPYFHSGQAKIGFNFSKLKNISLDLLLEKLKSSTLSEEKLKAIEKESLEVIKREAIIKTFYSPYLSFHIDKNIKNTYSIEMLPYMYYSYEIIKNSYIKEESKIDFTKKSTIGFFNWIKKHL